MAQYALAICFLITLTFILETIYFVRLSRQMARQVAHARRDILTAIDTPRATK